MTKERGLSTWFRCLDAASDDTLVEDIVVSAILAACEEERMACADHLREMAAQRADSISSVGLTMAASAIEARKTMEAST